MPRRSRKRSESQLAKLTRQIKEKEKALNNLLQRVKKVTNDLNIIRTKKSEYEKKLRRKKEGKISGYSGTAWNNAVKWLESNVTDDDYLESVWLKPNAKKGYEYAVYEPANRGCGYVGRGPIGMDYYDDKFAGEGLERNKILKLFPTKNAKILKKFNKIFDEHDKKLGLSERLLEMDKDGESEEKYDEARLLLSETINYLVNAVGFESIK